MNKLICIEFESDGRIIYRKTVTLDGISPCKTLFPWDDETPESVLICPSKYIRHPDQINLLCEYSRFMLSNEFKKENRIEGKRIEGDITEWEKEFFSKITSDQLDDLTKISNYLEHSHLLQVCCYEIANRMRGLTVVEIKKKTSAPIEKKVNYFECLELIDAITIPFLQMGFPVYCIYEIIAQKPSLVTLSYKEKINRILDNQRHFNKVKQSNFGSPLHPKC